MGFKLTIPRRKVIKKIVTAAEKISIKKGNKCIIKIGDETIELIDSVVQDIIKKINYL